ncbi:MAG: ATP-binding protein [Candidatus Limnocylindrales bacterium]
MMMATTTDPTPGPPDAREVVGRSDGSLEAHALSDDRSARAWRVIVGALAGLLVGIAVAFIVALGITLSVGAVADRAIRNDLELEDEADDLVAAVLDVRHYHRNLFFTGPTRSGLADFDEAVTTLNEELDEMAEVTIESTDVAQVPELRELVSRYVSDYRAAVALFETDRAAFDEASDEGLARLAELQQEARLLDALGEDLAADALRSVESTTVTATILLLAALLVVGLAAVAMTVAAVRVLREQRRLYAAQRESAVALGQALRTRTDFIADASHELRTPLTVLRGNAEVGLAAGPSDCGHEPVLREIVAESARMTRLVEDLLFLARYDAGSVPLDARAVDVEPWLADVAARAEVLARERGAVLDVDIDAHGSIDIDAERLQQAVLVLIDNAAKFSPGDEHVELRAVASGGAVEIEVADRGPGIAEDVRPFIFERFYRADRTRGRRSGGAGLGLSIARAIVDAHGGRIDARPRPGGGTSMRIHLPSASGAADPAPAVEQPVRQPSRAG